MQTIFLECAAFDDYGSWTLDTQCCVTSRIPYLMAHGIGKPVADASTAFRTDTPEEWHIFAFTRDWTAVWERGTPAGRFQISVDGEKLPETLGTCGEKWQWQSAGVLRLPPGKHRIALHDLTGFDGRCGALFLTPDPEKFPPPADVSSFRDKAVNSGVIEEDPQFYDLLVCGGGYAGICTALTAIKRGLKVLLVQDRPVLGGCGSSEIRVWTGGSVNIGIYPALGNPAAFLSPITGVPGQRKNAERFEDARKAMLFTEGKDLLLNEMVTAIEKDPDDPGRIVSILTRSLRSGITTRRRAALFTDCTGDALLARLCGCEVMYGRESREMYGEQLAPEKPDSMVMGHSTLWETALRKDPVSFPDIDWGIEFDDSNALKRFDCCWDWETGQYRNQVDEIEHIRDYGLMSCYCNWSFLKNRSARKAEWANWDLEWISAIGGKRESFRVKGDYVVTQQDIEEGRIADDATASATWSIDLHYPDPENRRIFGEAFQSCAYHRMYRKPYPIPYRSLYAKDMKNLFLGGRCISATHVAFSCIRVQRTLGMLGEVTAMAAAIARKYDTGCAEVGREHLDELKAEMECGVPWTPPFGGGTGVGEAYHFMRPVGMFGNPTENCWIHFDGNSMPVGDIPPELSEAIEMLDQTHSNGKKWREIQKELPPR